MKMVKSLLLGSAAGLVAMAGAQAADLPVKAKPVQYVKICSLYGAGFFYIPGTDTCLKVGGWVRYEQGWNYNGSFTNQFFNNNLQNRSTVDDTWRVKGVISFDARDQTEYGTLRSYATLGVSNSNVGDNATTANYVNRWFIQWAGFTIGHASSFYDFYAIGANQYGSSSGISDSTDGGWDVFGYTAQLGNGLSATIAAEVQRRTKINNAAGLALAAWGVPGAGYEGHDFPDGVANLRVDQAWGSAQIMGALHNVASLYYGATEGTGHPSDKMGGAIGAGITLKLGMIAPGDYFSAEVDWARGAARYTNHQTAVGDYIMYDGNRIGFGIQTDAVYGGALGATASSLELTQTWAASAAFTHFWNPAWKSTLWGNYLAFNYGSRANAILCVASGAGAGAGLAAVATPGCNMDWQVWGVGVRTEWAATKNLSIGLEVLYSQLQSADTGLTIGGIPNAIALGANGTKPAGTYAIDDQDVWAVRFRMTRNFYP